MVKKKKMLATYPSKREDVHMSVKAQTPRSGTRLVLGMYLNGGHDLLLLVSVEINEMLAASHWAQCGAICKKQIQRPVPLALGLLAL